MFSSCCYCRRKFSTGDLPLVSRILPFGHRQEDGRLFGNGWKRICEALVLGTVGREIQHQLRRVRPEALRGTDREGISQIDLSSAKQPS